VTLLAKRALKPLDARAGHEELQSVRLQQTRLHGVGVLPVQVDAGATAEVLVVGRRLLLQDPVDHPQAIDQVRDCRVDRDMRTAHAKLPITNAQFNALTEDLYIAFERVDVSYSLQNEMIALLAPMQRDIVKR
jgi:hypothetical protein